MLIRIPSDADAPVVAAPISGQDMMIGKVMDQQVRVRFRVDEDTSTTAEVFLLCADGWRSVTASVKLNPTSRLKRQVVIEPLVSVDSGLQPLAAKLAGCCFAGDNFQLVMHRSRSSSQPHSPWLKALSVAEDGFHTSSRLMNSLMNAAELKADIRQFQEWRKHFEDLSQRFSTVKQHQTVIFIGPSGVGTIKLISQMLGNADVLPSAGEGSAVTAAPIEIRFRPRPADFTMAAPGTVPQYWAEFELFSIKEFAEMRDQNIRALLDYWEMVEETASQIPARKPPQEDHARVALHAHDWLEAVCGTNTHV